MIRLPLLRLLESLDMKTFSRDVTSNTSSLPGDRGITAGNLHPALGKIARFLCCIFAMLVLTSLHVCYGQDVSGMTGEVTDPSGAALSGATVTLKNAATGQSFTATTNSQGVYRFNEVPPGQGYSATVSASGFTPVEIEQHLPHRGHSPHTECSFEGGHPGPGGPGDRFQLGSHHRHHHRHHRQHLRRAGTQQPPRAAEKRPNRALHAAAWRHRHRLRHRCPRRPE